MNLENFSKGHELKLKGIFFKKTKYLVIKIEKQNEKRVTQCFDDSMSSFSSEKEIKIFWKQFLTRHQTPYAQNYLFKFVTHLFKCVTFYTHIFTFYRLAEYILSCQNNLFPFHLEMIIWSHRNFA